ncbi:uncharacterized protein LOC117585180 [Drosophila guanche]|uniref:uncharacterized protein LOC117585180 n=1 Tax=Drosophila guanche TaxID=7266 RepID=UPI0014710850|nr:uncharacterized protein LOC117585180 [Drosophila guanche]
MGSIEKACISGFLCRLCSEMHRTVIHIYSDHGQRLCLVEKINGYLPITISPTDPLPKTICRTCLHRVEQHYSLLMRLTQMREERKIKGFEYKPSRETANASISSVECSDEEDNTTEPVGKTNRRHGRPTSESIKSKNTAKTHRNSSETNDESGSGSRIREEKGSGSRGTGQSTPALT